MRFTRSWFKGGQEPQLVAVLRVIIPEGCHIERYELAAISGSQHISAPGELDLKMNFAAELQQSSR
jgi:hypothetical protein